MPMLMLMMPLVMLAMMMIDDDTYGDDVLSSYARATEAYVRAHALRMHVHFYLAGSLRTCTCSHTPAWLEDYVAMLAFSCPSAFFSNSLIRAVSAAIF